MATATAVSRILFTMLAGFAEMETLLIGKRTADAMQHKNARHRDYARTPYGFDRKGDGLPPTPAEQVVIHQAHDSQRAGKSVHWIAGALARQQGPTTRGG